MNGLSIGPITITIGAIFLGFALLSLLSTCYAEKFFLFRFMVCAFGFLLAVFMLSEFVLGGYSIVGLNVMKSIQSGSTAPLPMDLNTAINSTWTACCTKNYNITLTYTLPPQVSNSLRSPPPSHQQQQPPQSNNGWLQVDVNNTANTLTAHADVEQICLALENMYTKENVQFDCVDYSNFRTSLFQIASHVLVIVASTSIIAGFMSLVTMIFSCCIACHRNNETRTIQGTPSYIVSSGSNQQPLIANGVVVSKGVNFV